MNTIAKAQGYALNRTANQVSQYMIFVMAGEVYAIGILNRKEIIDYADVRNLPMMSAFVRRLINLRGRMVPVIDLSASDYSEC